MHLWDCLLKEHYFNVNTKKEINCGPPGEHQTDDVGKGELFSFSEAQQQQKKEPPAPLTFFIRTRSYFGGCRKHSATG